MFRGNDENELLVMSRQDGRRIWPMLSAQNELLVMSRQLGIDGYFFDC